MLALVSRYVVNRDPSSEASTGAKKPDDSFRKTRLFISAAKLVCVLVSIYYKAGDATPETKKEAEASSCKLMPMAGDRTWLPCHHCRPLAQSRMT